MKSDLDEKKLNMHEKTKKAKPGLIIMDELEELAKQASAKGGAQVPIQMILRIKVPIRYAHDCSDSAKETVH